MSDNKESLLKENTHRIDIRAMAEEAKNRLAHSDRAMATPAAAVSEFQSSHTYSKWLWPVVVFSGIVMGIMGASLLINDSGRNDVPPSNTIIVSEGTTNADRTHQGTTPLTQPSIRNARPTPSPRVAIPLTPQSEKESVNKQKRPRNKRAVASKNPKSSKKKNRDILIPTSKKSKSTSALDRLLEEHSDISGDVPAKKVKKKVKRGKPLSRTQIKRVMRRIAPKVKRCAKIHRKEGRILLNIYVASSGKTKKVDILSKRYKKTKVGRCVAKIVKRTKFPSFTKKQMKIRYPFLLEY